MRGIIGNLFMAIDGVVEFPEKWSLSYWNDVANVVVGGMQGADALLLGRVTHREFADAWSDSPMPGPTVRSRTIRVRSS